MRPRWILPVVLVAVIVTAAAGIVARAVYTRPVESTAGAVGAPPQTPLPLADQPGDTTVVATTDAAAHPLYEAMRALLQAHFDAINSRDYDLWRSAVSARRAKGQPEKEWRIAFRTTRDGSIVIYRIESGPAGTAKILLSFTSVQDPRDAPLELPVGCIHWRVVFPVTYEEGVWKLDSGQTNTAPQHEACEEP